MGVTSTLNVLGNLALALVATVGVFRVRSELSFLRTPLRSLLLRIDQSYQSLRSLEESYHSSHDVVPKRKTEADPL